MHFKHTHNMHNMCRYNARQHNSTHVIYSIGSEERDITIMGLMTQHAENTSNESINMSGYRHLKMKKALEPNYLPDPAKGTRS